MDTTLTRYEVLQPTGIDKLYEAIGSFVYETEMYQTKTPEYIKRLLVNSGKYPDNIVVQYKG